MFGRKPKVTDKDIQILYRRNNSPTHSPYRKKESDSEEDSDNESKSTSEDDSEKREKLIRTKRRRSQSPEARKKPKKESGTTIQTQRERSQSPEARIKPNKESGTTIQTQRGRSQSPEKAPSLKVGLHEWMVVDLTKYKKITLWTSGLSNCIAVAIVTPTCAFVTHINGGITVENWDKTVVKEFLNAIGTIKDIDKAIECKVVCGQNPTLFPTVKDSVQGIMNVKTNRNCAFSDDELKSGVKVFLEGNKPHIEVVSSRNEPPSREALNSKTGAGHFENRGFFSGKDEFGRDVGFSRATVPGDKDSW